mgnify:FL=1
MSYAMIFGLVALACGAIALTCALLISVEEDISERKYGNGKETGFKDKQG